MDVISRNASSLNPHAPMFVPLAYRAVEDFSDHWWTLVQSCPWFREYWLEECFYDPQNDLSFADSYDLFDTGDDSFFNCEQSVNNDVKSDEMQNTKDLISLGSLKRRKPRAMDLAPRYCEKPPKIVNVKVSPRSIQQPR